MKQNKNKILYGIIVVLVLIIIIFVGYSLYKNYTAKKEQEQISIFQQGAQYGYEQAVLQLIQQAATCNQVPLFVGNETINVIAVECLQINQS